MKSHQLLNLSWFNYGRQSAENNQAVDFDRRNFLCGLGATLACLTLGVGLPVTKDRIIFVGTVEELPDGTFILRNWVFARPLSKNGLFLGDYYKLGLSKMLAVAKEDRDKKVCGWTIDELIERSMECP